MLKTTPRTQQERVAAPGCRFLPSGIRVVGAVVACPGLERLQRPLPQPWAGAACGDSEGQAGAMDLSPYQLLSPRKIELQAADLAASLQLLTRPAELLAFDFERQWPLPLQGQQRVRLPLLAQPEPLQVLLQHAHGDSSACSSNACSSTTQCAVLHWFEADCGAGGLLATAPGTTRTGHWQQSLEFVSPKISQQLLRAQRHGAGAVELAAWWGPDRVVVEVEAVVV